MDKSSTKPKGATSYKDTAFGIRPRSKLLPLELDGTKKGLEYVHNAVSDKQITSITPDLICKIHEVSFGWIFPAWAGKYRQVNVTYSSKEAPSFHQVPELTLNLCHDLKARIQNLPKQTEPQYITKIVKLLAWFQHRFVVIHPFKDYNGRIARMLTIMILLNLNLPPIELRAETKTDRQRYLKAMYQADEGKFQLLESLISDALTESLEKLK